ncbi:MAG: rhomboid family intramembrane serine protease [Sandaracinus sp.]
MTKDPKPIAPTNAAWPLGTLTLLFLLGLAFELDYGSRAHRGLGPEPLPALWVLDGADPKPWQFVSYAFVHGFRWHLHGNMMALLPSSLLVERRIGSARTIAHFLLLSVCVSVGFHLLDPRDLYGASGVTTGFIGMAALLWLLARDKAWWQRAIPLLLALAYVTREELWPAFQGHPSPGWKAHLVGAVCGIALALAHGKWRDAGNEVSPAALDP